MRENRPHGSYPQAIPSTNPKGIRIPISPMAIVAFETVQCVFILLTTGLLGGVQSHLSSALCTFIGFRKHWALG